MLILPVKNSFHEEIVGKIAVKGHYWRPRLKNGKWTICWGDYERGAQSPWSSKRYVRKYCKALNKRGMPSMIIEGYIY